MKATVKNYHFLIAVLVINLSIIFKASASITCTGQITHTACGANSGAISLSVSGGSTPYAYKWSNSATTSSLTNLAAGIYSATVKDNAGDSVIRSFEIAYKVTWDTMENMTPDAQGLRSTALATNFSSYAWGLNSINSSETGWVEFVINAGDTIQGFLALGSNHQFDETMEGLVVAILESDISVGGTQTGGFVNLGTYTIGTGYHLRIERLTDSIAVSLYNASATTLLNRLAFPFTAGSGSFFSPCVAGMQHGNRIAEINSSFDCSNLRIRCNATPGINHSFQGNLTTVVKGGTPPYSYTWNNAATTAGLTNVATGTYSVTVTDNVSSSIAASIFLGAHVAWDLLNNISVAINQQLNATGTGEHYARGLNAMRSSTQQILSYDLNRAGNYTGLLGIEDIPADRTIDLGDTTSPLVLGFLSLPESSEEFGDAGLYVITPEGLEYMGEINDSLPLNLKIYRYGDTIAYVKNDVGSISFNYPFDTTKFYPSLVALQLPGELYRATCNFPAFRLQPPVTPAPQTICADTAHIFTFNNIIAGAGGDQVEWAHNSYFIGSHIIYTGSSIIDTVAVGYTDSVWLRTVSYPGGPVSAITYTIAQVNQLPGMPFNLAPQAIVSDTSVILSLDSVLVGRGGSKLQWSYNESFTTFSQDSSPFRHSFTLTPDSMIVLWFRSLNEEDGCLSEISSTSLMVESSKVSLIQNDTVLYRCINDSLKLGITSLSGTYYKMKINEEIVDSAWGTGSLLILKTSPVDSSIRITICQQDSANPESCNNKYVFIPLSPVDTPVFIDPVAKATIGDTILFAAIAENALKMEYSVNQGSAVVDINTGLTTNIDSNFTIVVQASGAAGCGSLSTSLNVQVTDILPPAPMEDKEFYVDTAGNYTVTVDSILAGPNGDQVEWSLEESFSNASRHSSPFQLEIEMMPDADTVIYYRSRNSRTGASSKVLNFNVSLLLTLRSAGLIDKTTWTLQTGISDEFAYTKIDDPAFQSGFAGKWAPNLCWGSGADPCSPATCGNHVPIASWENAVFNSGNMDGTGIDGSGGEITFSNNYMSLNASHYYSPFNCNSITHYPEYKSGLLYGRKSFTMNSPWMCELRGKLSDAMFSWPSFWFWGWSIDGSRADYTEVDVIDNPVKDLSMVNMGIVNQINQSTSTYTCNTHIYNKTSCTYSDDWHTFTAAYIPNKLYYFIDGKLVWSTSVADWNMNILSHPIIGLTTTTSMQSNEAHYLVDYFRYYTTDNINPYCLQHRLLGQPLTLQTTSTISNDKLIKPSGMISTNQLNSERRIAVLGAGASLSLFYQGIFKDCYRLQGSNSGWTQYQLPSMPELVDNFLTTDGANRVYYKSKSNRLCYFKAPAFGTQWNNNVATLANGSIVNDCDGYLQKDDLGWIWYKSTSNTIKAWHPSGSSGYLQTIASASGAIAVTKAGNIVFYRDQNGKLRQLCKFMVQTSGWVYWTESPIPMVDQAIVTDNFALDEVNSRLYFIGTDHAVYYYRYNQKGTPTGDLVKLQERSKENDNSVFNCTEFYNAQSTLTLSPDKSLIFYRTSSGKNYFYFTDKEQNSASEANWYHMPFPFNQTNNNGHYTPVAFEDLTFGRLFYAAPSNGRLRVVNWGMAENDVNCPTTSDLQIDGNLFKKDPNDSNIDEEKPLTLIESRTTAKINTSYEIQITPNPNSGLCFVSINCIEPINLTITVFDISGATVLKTQSIINENAPISLNLSGVSNGIYYCQVESEFFGKCTKKLVLSR